VASTVPRRTDPEGPAPFGESRTRVLAALQDAGRPVDVTEVAKLVGLHVNTARFHLDGLVDAGVAGRETEQRERPGRPRTLYAARPDAERAGVRSYQLLAEILTSFVAAQIPQPARAAQKAGREWGRYLTERPGPFERVTAATATRHLVDALDSLGFAPEAKSAGTKRQILLHHCPFRESASKHQEVVCSVHLGLMQGMLAELDAPIDTDRLDPFVEPNLCIARLSRRPQPGGTPTRLGRVAKRVASGQRLTTLSSSALTRPIG
jgi:predicted ArsR family transcriptional regulator